MPTSPSTLSDARVRAEASRVAQGLPPTIDDPTVLARVAALLARSAA